MIDPNPKRRRFQFSLRGLLLVVSLFALSFGLWRKASMIEDDSGFLWFAAGLYAFAGTIAAAIERLIDSRRSGIVGVLISVVLVSLVLYVCFVGSRLAALSNALG